MSVVPNTMQKRANYLVVDTSAFIHNAPLREIGANLVTVNEVIQEVRNKRQLRHLASSLLDIQVKYVFPENIAFVSNFAKKTGDYIELSPTDIKVIALTYQLEKEKNGTDHLKTEPTVALTVNYTRKSLLSPSDVPGFYSSENARKNVQKAKAKDVEEKKSSTMADTKKHMEENTNEDGKSESDDEHREEMESNGSSESDTNSAEMTSDQLEDYLREFDEEFENELLAENAEDPSTMGDFENQWADAIAEFRKAENESDDEFYSAGSGDEGSLCGDIAKVNIEETRKTTKLVEEVKNGNIDGCEKKSELSSKVDGDSEADDKDSDDDFESDSGVDGNTDVDGDDVEDGDSDGDNGAWVTPNNLRDIVTSDNSGLFEDRNVDVGCITSDFAMQNVLKQIGLNLLSTNGRVIKEVRTFVFRCYTCKKICKNMSKVFCPKCGNRTLKRVAVSLAEDGTLIVHINLRRPISKKGKRFSLPTFKSGKHAVNPRLVEDARRPHQRQSRLARTKTDCMHEDYTAGVSPFAIRDTHSRSAQIGFNRGKPVHKYWMQKNPNEPKRRASKKK